MQHLGMQNLDRQFRVAIILSLACFLWQPLHAQVVIKDTVVISTGLGIRPSGPLSPDTTHIFFVAPRSGVLGIVPISARKLVDSLPGGSYFSIQLPDTTYTPLLLPYFPYHDYGCCNSHVVCGAPQTFTGRHDYRSYVNWGDWQDTFYTKPVQADDTVRFAFYGEYHNPTAYLSGSENLWSLRMETPCYEPPEECELYFFFADTLVKFKRPDSINVYPYYPGRNDTVTVGPTKRFVDLELRVEFADSAIPNRWVRVDRPVLVDSGGHSHDGDRPLGRYVYPIGPTGPSDTILAQTDSEGKLRFRYLASQFGGIERIRARLVSDTTKFDTLSLTTRVKHLFDFATISSNFWDLVGNTGNTQYERCPNTPIRHYSNHWFDSLYVDSVQRSILNFFKWSGTTEGGGQYLVLRANDMSLIYGGLFDICSTWQTGHASHRVGNDADFNTSARLFGGVNFVPLDSFKVDYLTEFMQDNGGTRIPEEKIHYRFLRR